MNRAKSVRRRAFLHGLFRLAVEPLEDRRLLAAVNDLTGSFSQLAIDPGKYRSTSLLVQFRPGATAAAVAGTNLGAVWEIAPGLHEVTLDSQTDFLAALAAYKESPDVLFAEPDFRVSLALAPNDPSFGALWGLNNTGQTGGTPDADIDAPEAWDVTTGATSVVVSVIDTGVDYTHPDLYRNIWINQDEIPSTIRSGLIDVDGDGLITFYDLNNALNQGAGKITDLNANGRIDGGDLLNNSSGWENGQDNDADGKIDDLIGWNFVSNTNNPLDDHFHGTHVSGTIGAMGNNAVGVAGVNWTVQMMSLKFLDSFGGGFTSDAIDALNFAVANGAAVSNNSWGGGGFSAALQAAIQNAAAAGHIFVAAAGNDSSNNDFSPSYPASYPVDNVVAVAASDHNDALAWFSNYGPTTVHLAAPGQDIHCTFPTYVTNAMASEGFTANYGTISGTSMATPHVAGVVALVRGLHPDWTYTQVIDQVLSSVDLVPALAGNTVTGGRLNAAIAVGVDFGPRVVAHTPSGSLTGSVSNLQFTFSEPVTGFTTEDIFGFTGPGGIDLKPMVTGVSGSGANYTVSFAPQGALGAYSMVIGPDILDASNQQMDQNRNVINGEIPGDRYTATFTVTNELVFHSTDVPAPVLSLYTTISYLTVNQPVTIGDLNLQLDISFPVDLDLDISLRSPQGTIVSLYSGSAYYPRSWGSDFNNTKFDDQSTTHISVGSPPYPGTYRPHSPLSAMNGQNAIGTWELQISDIPWSGFFNDGWLNAWSLTIQPPGSSNRPPDAVNDTTSTLEDAAVTVAVLANDHDPDNDPITVTGVTQGTKGSVVINANNTVTYTPNANANGADTFQYTISDGKGGTDTAAVSVTINPVNDAPAGADKTVTTSLNTAYTFAAADFGFSDPNDSPPNSFQAVQITTLPAAGSLTLSGADIVAGQFISKADLDAGNLQFTPAADASGSPYANFTFQVRDNGGGSDLDPTPNTITINVPAGNNPPVAVNNGYATAEDAALTITAPGVLANDSDVDGDPLNAILVSGPSHGTLTLNSNGSFSYMPVANYNGPDSFTYKANDGTGDSNVAAVSITVNPVNDAPVANNDAAYSTNEDTILTVAAQGVLANDTDVDGHPLTAILVSGPSHGTLTLNSNGSFNYTPAANYNGPDGFTYKANDGAANSNVATVNIAVNPVNDPPGAVNDSYSVGKGGTSAPPAPGVLGNDSDPDGDPLTAVLISGPSHGTLTLNSNGSFTYVHDGSETTSDSFTYQASDGALSSSIATVSITVQEDLDYYYFSTTAGGTLGGVSFSDADILRLEISAGDNYSYSIYFDGSDVGLTTGNEDIDAFAILPNGTIVVSTVGSYSVPGPIGEFTGNGSNLLAFTPSSLGENTAGTWSLYLQGSSVGLSGGGENIDAVALLTDGSLVISTTGNVAVPGASGVDKDLLRYASGTWEIYFDGGDVDLTTSNEDVDAVFIRENAAGEPTLFLSTQGNFSVTGAGGANEDVLQFDPIALGDTTSGAYSLALVGNLYGLASLDLDGIFIGVAPNESLVAANAASASASSFRPGAEAPSGAETSNSPLTPSIGALVAHDLFFQRLGEQLARQLETRIVAPPPRSTLSPPSPVAHADTVDRALADWTTHSTDSGAGEPSLLRPKRALADDLSGELSRNDVRLKEEWL